MLPADPSSGVAFYSLASNGNGTSRPDETFLDLRTGTNTYRFVGIPDGMSVYEASEDGPGIFRVVCNHELGATVGIIRAHGNKGSFVSEWQIRKADLSIVGARDLATTSYLWNTTTDSWDMYNTATPMPSGWARFCSGDMAAPSAYKFGKFGTDALLHMCGEETGAEGRAVAHVVTGTGAGATWELPRLGKYSWENSVTNPYSQLKTVHIGTDDSTPGQVYIYVGTKTDSGNEVQRAGLTNGGLYGVKITGGPCAEDRAFALGSTSEGVVYTKPFELHSFGDVTELTGAQLQDQSNANCVINWNRPEDVAWDPTNLKRAIFCTTDNFAGNSRLWALEFSDIEQTELGGTVTMLADGAVPSTLAGGYISANGLTDVRMMDNLAVSRFGQVLIQEDVGNNARLGRLWLYDIAADSMTEIGISDANSFVTGAAAFLTQDEETSGIVDAYDIVGPGWWILNMQAHYPSTVELVEGGQLLAVYIPETVECAVDFDGDGFVTGTDYDRYVVAFEAGHIGADFDRDGFVTGLDFDAYVQSFEAGCE